MTTLPTINRALWIAFFAATASLLVFREDWSLGMGEYNSTLYFASLVGLCGIAFRMKEDALHYLYVSLAAFVSYLGLLYALSIETSFLTGPSFPIFLSIALFVSWFADLVKKNYRPPADQRYRWKRKNALIIGAGSAGAIVANELRFSPHSTLNPVGFIDDNENKQFKRLDGLKVFGGVEDLSYLIEQLEIKTVVIAIPSASRQTIKDIVEKCRKMNVEVKTVPKLVDIIEGRISINMIRDVQVEDLLGREPIQLDLKPISDYMRDKVVLITGAGGSIGSELCRQVTQFSPRQLLILGRGENSIYMIENELKKSAPTQSVTSIIADVQDEWSIERVFKKYRPDVVFHAAAHKHVPLMEKQPEESIKNNIFGTQNMAALAHKYSTERFILISTDKAVNPTSVMGATKRLAETIIQHYNQHSETKFSAVRFGNVLGSRGSVVLLFKEQIAAGGPVTVTHPDMIRYFMTIPEGVQLVLQAGSYTEGGEIFLLDMGEQMKIVDLASDLIRLSGLEPDVDIKIEFTGIRPGEKLFEEMMHAEEGTSSTKHSLIYQAKLKSFDEKIWEKTIEDLNELVHSNQDVPAHTYKETIARFIPNYTPFDPKHY
ncbi:polysaccharide biosynthesis protein [Halobacillus salinus]|uniref:polysaccharide biosynthesis protein n=1 Tax=Halobacillus salinus TaxID=192814 RepID=UPI00111710D5|nr:nucleoside-diphosphate sugar epimerase/dehydratase [Halobacillus salinus]